MRHIRRLLVLLPLAAIAVAPSAFGAATTFRPHVEVWRDPANPLSATLIVQNMSDQEELDCWRWVLPFRILSAQIVGPGNFVTGPTSDLMGLAAQVRPGMNGIAHGDQARWTVTLSQAIPQGTGFFASSTCAPGSDVQVTIDPDTTGTPPPLPQPSDPCLAEEKKVAELEAKEEVLAEEYAKRQAAWSAARAVKERLKTEMDGLHAGFTFFGALVGELDKAEHEFAGADLALTAANDALDKTGHELSDTRAALAAAQKDLEACKQRHPLRALAAAPASCDAQDVAVSLATGRTEGFAALTRLFARANLATGSQKLTAVARALRRLAGRLELTRTAKGRAFAQRLRRAAADATAAAGGLARLAAQVAASKQRAAAATAALATAQQALTKCKGG